MARIILGMLMVLAVSDCDDNSWQGKLVQRAYWQRACRNHANEIVWKGYYVRGWFGGYYAYDPATDQIGPEFTPPCWPPDYYVIEH